MNKCITHISIQPKHFLLFSSLTNGKRRGEIDWTGRKFYESLPLRENCHVNAIDKMKIFSSSNNNNSTWRNENMCIEEEQQGKNCSQCLHTVIHIAKLRERESFNACIKDINHKSDHRNVMFFSVFFSLCLFMECGWLSESE